MSIGIILEAEQSGKKQTLVEIINDFPGNPEIAIKVHRHGKHYTPPETDGITIEAPGTIDIHLGPGAMHYSPEHYFFHSSRFMSHLSGILRLWIISAEEDVRDAKDYRQQASRRSSSAFSKAMAYASKSLSLWPTGRTFPAHAIKVLASWENQQRHMELLDAVLEYGSGFFTGIFPNTSTENSKVHFAELNKSMTTCRASVMRLIFLTEQGRYLLQNVYSSLISPAKVNYPNATPLLLFNTTYR